MKVEDEQRTQPSTSPEASTSTTQGDGPPKKKQKRNKPTLSCEECVERKTKVRIPCSFRRNCWRPVGCSWRPRAESGDDDVDEQVNG